MKVNVILASGGQLELHDLDEKATVLDLKTAIAGQRGHDQAPVQRQRVISRGRELKDEEVLGAYGVVDGTVLHVALRPIGAVATPQYEDQRAVDLSPRPPPNVVHNPNRSAAQMDQICLTFDLSTRICVLAIIDGIALWMVLLLSDPIWVPICLFVAVGYYGATNYSSPMLTAFAAFLASLTTISGYLIFLKPADSSASIGIMSIVWHLYVIVQANKLTLAIGKLSANDLALLRSLESATIRPALTTWIPSRRRPAAAAPAA